MINELAYDFNEKPNQEEQIRKNGYQVHEMQKYYAEVKEKMDKALQEALDKAYVYHADELLKNIGKGYNTVSYEYNQATLAKFGLRQGRADDFVAKLRERFFEAGYEVFNRKPTELRVSLPKII